MSSFTWEVPRLGAPAPKAASSRATEAEEAASSRASVTEEEVQPPPPTWEPPTWQPPWEPPRLGAPAPWPTQLPLPPPAKADGPVASVVQPRTAHKGPPLRHAQWPAQCQLPPPVGRAVPTQPAGPPPGWVPTQPAGPPPVPTQPAGAPPGWKPSPPGRAASAEPTARPHKGAPHRRSASVVAPKVKDDSDEDEDHVTFAGLSRPAAPNPDGGFRPDLPFMPKPWQRSRGRAVGLVEDR